MKKGLTELVFILDRSGSMNGLEKDTIGGYNSMLKQQKNVEGDCRITTVLFDNNYFLLHDRVDLKAVKEITDAEYQVGGTTALLDAIGITINKIVNVQKSTSKEYQADKVLFVIITDGEENSSREYSSDKVKQMIEQQKNQYNWEFIFLAANIDAVQTAASFGIQSDRVAEYIADSIGTVSNYHSISNAAASFRKQGVIDETYLEQIREDTKKRKKNQK